VVAHLTYQDKGLALACADELLCAHRVLELQSEQFFLCKLYHPLVGVGHDGELARGRQMKPFGHPVEQLVEWLHSLLDGHQATQRSTVAASLSWWQELLFWKDALKQLEVLV